jgi:hypothetical protein
VDELLRQIPTSTLSFDMFHWQAKTHGALDGLALTGCSTQACWPRPWRPGAQGARARWRQARGADSSVCCARENGNTGFTGVAPSFT